MGMLHLVTERMRLRPFEVGDAEAAARLVSDPDVIRFMGGTVISPEEIAAAIQGHAERSYVAHGLGVLAGVLKSTGMLVGRYGLQYSEVDGSRELELSAITDRAHRGEGFASEAVNGLLAAAGQEGFGRVVALVMPENSRSRGLVEKCGLAFQRQIEHKGLLMNLYVTDPRGLSGAG